MIDYMGPSLDTTIFAIISAVWLFAQHPDQWELLRQDPKLIPAAMNEVLRMEAPIQGFSRLAVTDYDMDGVSTPAGSRAIAFYGAANRDEREYPDPDRFDVRRNPANHLAFGTGPHVCVGVYLARLGTWRGGSRPRCWPRWASTGTGPRRAATPRWHSWRRRGCAPSPGPDRAARPSLWSVRRTTGGRRHENDSGSALTTGSPLAEVRARDRGLPLPERGGALSPPAHAESPSGRFVGSVPNLCCVRGAWPDGVFVTVCSAEVGVGVVPPLCVLAYDDLQVHPFGAMSERQLPMEGVMQGEGIVGRGVIEAAFALLDQVRALEPARLVDLAAASGIPRPTVHRLLAQLIEVGAVRRDGRRYRLGLRALGFGAGGQVERRLRAVAGRPLAELATRTGAGVLLTVAIDGEAVFLDTLDARRPLGLVAEPGSPVWPGTAVARAHARGLEARPALCVDGGEIITEVSCVSMPILLAGGGVAAISTIAPGSRPSPVLLAATRATAARIADSLWDASPPQFAH
jgi:IclR family acetate operon transcriptional repressor